MKNNKFLLALFIPLLILFGMAVKPTATYLFGERIILETIPIDPRDLFYGDYVSLNLAISEVPKEDLNQELLQTLNENQNNQTNFLVGSPSVTVYTILEKGVDVYTVTEVSLVKPKNGLYMKGKIHYYLAENPNVVIDYNLDRYYVEENTGIQLEKAAQEGKVKVVVKICKGYALFDEWLLP